MYIYIYMYHPFECPELVAVDITAGLPEYLK